MINRKVLTVARVDTDNCRLYVTDQEGSKYVLLDHGNHYAKYNLFRYELYTHTDEGEPCTPLDNSVYWELPDADKYLVWNRGGQTPTVDLSNRNMLYEAALARIDLSTLNILEKRFYEHHIQSTDKIGALKIIINSVEGDYSQLSPKLAEIAEELYC